MGYPTNVNHSDATRMTRGSALFMFAGERQLSPLHWHNATTVASTSDLEIIKATTPNRGRLLSTYVTTPGVRVLG